MTGPKTKGYADLLLRALDRQGSNPVYLICYVTSKCNMKCRHCFYWKSLNKEKHELTLEEHKKISASMGRLLFLSLTGGEPFLRDDLPEIAETYCRNNGVKKLAIPTNGSLTEKIIADAGRILRLCPDTSLDINLSIDGIGADHDRIRGVKGSFDKVMKTYAGLAELKKKNKRLGITALATFSAMNQHKMHSLYAFVKKELPRAAFSLNLVRGQPREPVVADINIELFKKITDEIVRDYEAKGRFNKNAMFSKVSAAKNALRYRLITETYKKRKYISLCYAAQLNGVMYENGDVFGCELLNKKIGNVRDYNYDFKRLWRSSESKKLIKFIRETKCFCTHECAWTTNILFNPRFYPRLAFDSILL